MEKFSKTKFFKILKPTLYLIALFLVLASLWDYPVKVTAEPGWWNDSWTKRRQITFDNSDSSENLTGFPVLVELNSSRIDYSYTQNNGEDIRFVDDDDLTELAYEIEDWNESGTSFVWVKVPEIRADNTDYIWLYYGNPGALDGQNVAATWSNDHQGVWHLADETSTLTLDSAFSNDGVKGAANEPQEISGQIYKAQSFDGVDDIVEISSPSSVLDITENITLSAWVYLLSDSDLFGEYGSRIISRSDGGSSDNYAMRILGNKADWRTRIDENPYNFSGPTILSLDTWYYLTLTYDGSNQRIYVNGTEDRSVAKTGLLDVDATGLSFGSHIDNPANRRLNGAIDEARISSVARSEDWIYAQYLSQTDAFAAFGSEQTQEATPTLHNIQGWAWSDNIGWISFNCNNPELDEPRCLEDYGVDLETDDTFSGYAWSDNIGWIKFDPAPDFVTGLYPEDPQVSARMNGLQAEGWARACAGTVNKDCNSATRGDWDGWIKMSGIATDASPYGVSLNGSDFEGWAWGSDVIGWISFNCLNEDSCDTSDYKVGMLNQPPDAPSALIENINRCAWGLSPQAATGFLVNLEWVYTGLDPEGDPQEAYEVLVDNNLDFLSPEFSSVADPNSTNNCNVAPPSDLSWGTTYYWKVKVKDSGSGTWSEFSECLPGTCPSFDTPVNAYPKSDFSWLPQKPTRDEVIIFTDGTVFYDGGTPGEGNNNWDWTWNMDDGLPPTTATSTFNYSYSTKGIYSVNLQSTDANGYSCPKTWPVEVGWTLPKWKEIKP